MKKKESCLIVAGNTPCVELNPALNVITVDLLLEGAN